MPIRRRNAKPNTVNMLLTVFVGSRETAALVRGGMDSVFIHGRVALDDAAQLIEQFGDDAGFEAAIRAERSRDLGNVARFCHWRHIERLIATLSSEEVLGTIH